MHLCTCLCTHTSALLTEYMHACMCGPECYIASKGKVHICTCTGAGEREARQAGRQVDWVLGGWLPEHAPARPAQPVLPPTSPAQPGPSSLDELPGRPPWTGTSYPYPAKTATARAREQVCARVLVRGCALAGRARACARAFARTCAWVRATGRPAGGGPRRRRRPRPGPELRQDRPTCAQRKLCSGNESLASRSRSRSRGRGSGSSSRRKL